MCLQRRASFLDKFLLTTLHLDKDKYENTAKMDAFVTLYYEAASATTETEFEKLRLALKAQCAELAQYLDVHW
jgi:hypothetical protein